MASVGLVVEGLIDRVAAEQILLSRGLEVDPYRMIVTNGKTTFDARLLKYNRADSESFARHFSIATSKIPTVPEQLDRPKDALVNACRSSRRRDVRAAMVPPIGRPGTGPEYTSFISRYCAEAWRPDVAAATAPSLQSALREIDRLVGRGVW